MYDSLLFKAIIRGILKTICFMFTCIEIKSLKIKVRAFRRTTRDE